MCFAENFVGVDVNSSYRDPIWPEEKDFECHEAVKVTNKEAQRLTAFSNASVPRRPAVMVGSAADVLLQCCRGGCYSSLGNEHHVL